MLLAIATTDPLTPSHEMEWAIARAAMALVCLLTAISLGAHASSKRVAIGRRVRCAAWGCAWFFVFGLQLLVITQSAVKHVSRWEMLMSEILLGAAFLTGEIAGIVSRRYNSSCRESIRSTPPTATASPNLPNTQQMAAVA